jgi:hypothetical protein
MSYLSQVAISFNKHFNMHKFKCILLVEVESVSDSDLRKKEKAVSLHAKKVQGEVTLNQTLCHREGGLSVSCSDLFTPRGRDPVLISRALVEPRCRSDFVRKISPPTEFEPWTTQPVASRCTYWAIPASQLHSALNIYLFVDSKQKSIWTNTTDLIFGVTYLCSLWLQTFSHFNKTQGYYWVDGPEFASRWRREFP